MACTLPRTKQRGIVDDGLPLVVMGEMNVESGYDTRAWPKREGGPNIRNRRSTNMVTRRQKLSRIGGFWVVFLAMMLVLSATSCGGQEPGDAGAAEPVAAEPAVAVVVAEDAEVGKILQSDEWSVSITQQPEKPELVGSGPVVESFERTMRSVDMDAAGIGHAGSIAAEGTWLVVAIEITNDLDDLTMLTRGVLKVTDAQGGEYEAAPNVIQFMSIEGDDRWLDLRQHHLIEYVFEEGEGRIGPLTFDVPADATGLKLTLEGTDETIDLGF